MSFVPSIGWTSRFVARRLSIAVLPLAAPRLWESNLRKLGVAAVLALTFLALAQGLGLPAEGGGVPSLVTLLSFRP